MKIKPTSDYQKNPNPQGKGMVPVLRDWESMQPGTAVVKEPDELLRDYCLSSLVLAARFSFKPVVGKTYYLYFSEGGWMMSLVGPDEWASQQHKAFLGCCVLRADMTWEIETRQQGKVDEEAMERAQEFVHGFVATLTGQEAIDDELPFYVEELPYYQRLLATALAASLRRSLPVIGTELRVMLEGPRDWLLPRHGISHDHQGKAADLEAEFSHR